VTFVTADVLAWAPPRRFDTVFFAFWLSYVPASAFGRFWSLVRAALASSGRVLFVDDQPAATGLETYVVGSDEVVERHLRDGTRHRLIKVARDPAGLTRQLTRLGWQTTITTSGDWLVGEVRPVP
jgi:demethylmenaquinone methyltransferase/2-methoxy-6-polyprenyl-1,4-benzoquinol methylase